MDRLPYLVGLPIAIGIIIFLISDGPRRPTLEKQAVNEPDSSPDEVYLAKLNRWLGLGLAVHPLVGLFVMFMLPGEPSLSKWLFLMPAIAFATLAALSILGKKKLGISFFSFVSKMANRDSISPAKLVAVVIFYMGACFGVGLAEL